ncbi:MAG TPA: hypothetical protein VMI47_13215 [Pseudolabrys sp.]|nr:hypothetical protein [Pseudolabrys sp.]
MRMMAMAVLIAAASAIAVQHAQAQQQQNRIVSKKSCNPDACIKAVRQKGYPFATAASWCAAHNNGC